MSVDRGIDQHARAVQNRAVNGPGMGDAGVLEPCRPRLAVVEVQQRKLEHVRRPRELCRELGTAHRKQVFGAEPGDVQARPMALTVADRNIDVFAGEIDVMHRRRDPKVDPGMGLDEPPEPVDQPLGREIRQGADREDARILPLQQAFCSHRVTQGVGRAVAAMNANAVRMAASAGGGLVAIYGFDLGVPGFFAAVAGGFCIYAALLVRAVTGVKTPDTARKAAA